MSTLKVTNIQDTSGGNSLSTQQLYSGSAKAWVNFSGAGSVSSNQTIRASFNVSSVYKNAAGDYTVNFTNVLVDGNYVLSGSGMEAAGLNSGATFQSAVSLGSDTTMLTGSVRILNANIDTNGNADGNIITVVIFR